MPGFENKKERHEIELKAYLGDPSNEWLPRKRLSTDVLGFKQDNQIHKVFTPDELNEIEWAALELRRQKYSKLVSLVDMALLKKAAEGDVQAAKLVYQRFENWSERHRVEEDHQLTIQVVRFDGAPPRQITINAENERIEHG